MIVVYHYDDQHDLERWFQYQILNRSFDKAAIGWVEADGIYSLQNRVELLYPYMDWNISLDQEILISYPKITKIQTASCVYPIELEKKIKSAICAYDWEGVSKIMQEFRESFQDGQIYMPKEIKECYVRFLWVVISIAKEIGCMEQQKPDSQKLIEMIMNARTKEELCHATDFLLALMVPYQNKGDSVHLTVKKVKSMIHEFYQTGITLEEISVRLNMTPEYIGTLFHKEMGITFSAYMKSYRINKAKELLCGTQYKLYEIAERVGYHDPKYFSKVFKEITGQLPTDYRKTYK
ncbi:MAG: helix-turn-helix transcriptional regulator [Lachnospiraceae bacterium]|nr:helix-turn-helix transcriptional regulator [Lachnospiraceae bacterium]